jgi:hypothetical protein
VATVENRSPVLGRVKQVEVWSREGRKSYPGFPLFPGQRRAIQLDWAQSMSPERLVLEFGAFAVEHPIAR